MYNTMSDTNIKAPLTLLSKLTSAYDTELDSLHHELSLQQLLDEIQNDLNNLLNHKRIFLETQDHSEQLLDSILYYGLPDLSVYNPLSDQDRKEVRNLLEQTITNFEKRLRNVYVIDEAEKYHLPSLTMHFHISAELEFMPELIPVTFDSTIQTPSDDVFISSGKSVDY